MMRFVFLAGFFWSLQVSAAVINIEFEFTPYTGDPTTADEVETVPGSAKIFLNNVLFAEQAVRKDTVPVLFDEREIAPSVWLPLASAGPVVRKGKNTFRIEFSPEDPKLNYHAQLRWASVNDETYSETTEDGGTATNQSNKGVDDKAVTGKSVQEHEFVADFATDLPWHHYPAVSELSDADRTALIALVADRAAQFKPGFENVYAILARIPDIQVDQIKQMKCLDEVYAAGLRVQSPDQDQLDMTLTGNPEVVITPKSGNELFTMQNKEVVEKIKDENKQMCAGFALYVAFPPKLVVVHNPDGNWEIVY